MAMLNNQRVSNLHWKSKDSKSLSSWISVESGREKSTSMSDTSWCTFWGPGPQKEHCYKHPFNVPFEVPDLKASLIVSNREQDPKKYGPRALNRDHKKCLSAMTCPNETHDISLAQKGA